MTVATPLAAPAPTPALSAAASAARRAVLAAMGLGSLLLTADMFVVTVALPSIASEFAAAPDQVSWVMAANALALGVFTLAMGRLGDIIGRKRVYMAGLIVYMAMSLACGLSNSIWMLIGFRTLQGLGAAAMWPGSLSLLVQAFPPEQRGRVIGIQGGIAGIGLIIGPLMGGLLASLDSWRWVFFVNLPIGVIALLLTARGVGESRDETVAKRIDWLGVALISLALLVLMVGVKQATLHGIAAAPAWGPIAGCVALLGLFVAWERHTATPLIELNLFLNRQFAIACAVAFLFFAGNFGALPYLSLFMQNFLDLNAWEGGLAFLPATAPVALTMLLGGGFAQKNAHRIGLVFALAGTFLIAAGIWIILFVTPHSSYWFGLMPSYVIRGVGIGLMVSATSFAAMSSLPPQKSGLASGTVSMARQIGTGIGVALCAAAFVSAIQGSLPVGADAQAVGQALRFHAVNEAMRQPVIDGFMGMTIFSTVLFVAAVLLALTLKAKKPA